MNDDLDAISQSLRDSKSRVIASALAAAAYVRLLASQGDPVAVTLVQDLDAAFDEMRAENIAAGSMIAERKDGP
jgi:hypothetical protein